MESPAVPSIPQRTMTLTVILLLHLCTSCLTAHVHHDVHNQIHSGSKERISDGHQHYSLDGTHNQDFDHQAILGSKKDAAVFDHLTDAESKERLKLLVTRGGMDADGNGHVDMIELKDWIMKSFHKLTLEEGTERHTEEDANKDGYVSWQEHLADAFDINLDQDYEELNDPENKQMLDEDRALWRAADADHDDRLNVTEFTMFNSPEEFDGPMRDVLYELTMIRRDKNKEN